MNKVLKSNSGQSLVLFLVLLLAILMFATFVIDLTNSKQNEKTLENTCKLIINYGLKHIDEDIEKKLENLLKENEKDLDDYKILIDPFLIKCPDYDYSKTTDIFVTHGHGDHLGESIKISKETN